MIAGTMVRHDDDMGGNTGTMVANNSGTMISNNSGTMVVGTLVFGARRENLSVSLSQITFDK